MAAVAPKSVEGASQRSRVTAWARSGAARPGPRTAIHWGAKRAVTTLRPANMQMNTRAARAKSAPRSGPCQSRSMGTNANSIVFTTTEFSVSSGADRDGQRIRARVRAQQIGRDRDAEKSGDIAEQNARPHHQSALHQPALAQFLDQYRTGAMTTVLTPGGG